MKEKYSIDYDISKVTKSEDKYNDISDIINKFSKVNSIISNAKKALDQRLDNLKSNMSMMNNVGVSLVEEENDETIRDATVKRAIVEQKITSMLK